MKNKKTILKIMVDICMTLAILFLMPYELVGSLLHEIIGTLVIVLLIVHHLLNRKWTAEMFHGKYTLRRSVQTLMIVLMMLCVLGSAVSGIALSRHLYRFLPSLIGADFARKTHMLCAYWGLIIMSLHLGFHWNVMLNKIKKLFCRKKACGTILRIIGFTAAGYGIYAFWKRDIADYLFLKTVFVFFDRNEPLILLILDYAALMAAFVLIGHYLSKWLIHLQKRKKK